MGPDTVCVPSVLGHDSEGPYFCPDPPLSRRGGGRARHRHPERLCTCSRRAPRPRWEGQTPRSGCSPFPPGRCGNRRDGSGPRRTEAKGLNTVEFALSTRVCSPPLPGVRHLWGAVRPLSSGEGQQPGVQGLTLEAPRVRDDTPAVSGQAERDWCGRLDRTSSGPVAITGEPGVTWPWQ